MEIKYHVLTGGDQGDEKEERPAVRIKVEGTLLDLVAGAVPAEVTRHGGMIMETPYPTLT